MGGKKTIIKYLMLIYILYLKTFLLSAEIHNKQLNDLKIWFGFYCTVLGKHKQFRR